VETVRTHFPQLMDLVEDGTLVVVKRAVDYVERRSDGYVEPEVVFVVGTAHMSRVSALQVTRVVNAVQPENVVVELCRSRAGIMYDVVVPAAAPITESNVANLMQGQQQQQQQQQNPNLMSMSGDNFGSAVSRSLELGGRSALVLRLLLGAMSKRISSSAGVATGEEFRAACKAAEEIGAQIVLGDRPIEITVSSQTWNLETL
jgi:pheromone shutdown protein TraB